MSLPLVRAQFGKRLFFVLALVGFVWLSSGCGDGGPSLYPVKGTVKVGDKAMTSGLVTLKPDKSKGNTFTGEPRGEINAQGEYVIETNGKPGAPLGAYKVTVAVTGATTEDNTKAQPKLMNNITYVHPDTTPLAYEVVKEAAPGAYDLKLTP